jgi:hypothetical protein
VHRLVVVRLRGVTVVVLVSQVALLECMLAVCPDPPGVLAVVP